MQKHGPYFIKSFGAEADKVPHRSVHFNCKKESYWEYNKLHVIKERQDALDYLRKTFYD